MMNTIPKKAGVIGWPIDHSLSPKLHGFWLKKYKINGSYVPLAIEPEKFKEKLHLLLKESFCGINLTVPHKEAALRIVDRLDPLAKRVGAVNTIIIHEKGIMEGRNTDVYGFKENLLTGGFKVNHRPVVLLGAGGAARAAIVALEEMGVEEIRISNRTRSRAEALAVEFGPLISVFDWQDEKAFEGAALLINATSLGLKGQTKLDIELGKLPLDAFVTDMVYTPLMTELLKKAKDRGHEIIDGLGMLLHQAQPAFAAFYGVVPMVTDELRAFLLEPR